MARTATKEVAQMPGELDQDIQYHFMKQSISAGYGADGSIPGPEFDTKINGWLSAGWQILQIDFLEVVREAGAQGGHFKSLEYAVHLIKYKNGAGTNGKK